MNDKYVGAGIKAPQIWDKFVAVVVIPFCYTPKKALKTFPPLVPTLSNRLPEKHAYLFFPLKVRNEKKEFHMLLTGYKLAALRR